MAWQAIVDHCSKTITSWVQVLAWTRGIPIHCTHAFELICWASYPRTPWAHAKLPCMYLLPICMYALATTYPYACTYLSYACMPMEPYAPYVYKIVIASLSLSLSGYHLLQVSHTKSTFCTRSPPSFHPLFVMCLFRRKTLQRIIFSFFLFKQDWWGDNLTTTTNTMSSHPSRIKTRPPI